MKVKEMIEKLQACNPEAEVVKSGKFDYTGVDIVSELHLIEAKIVGELFWVDSAPFEKGSFPAVYLGI